MEADGELVARRADLRAAVGGEEDVLAVDPAAVGRQHQRALVDDAEAVGIAVVRGAQAR